MGIVELEQRVLSMQVVEQAFICQNITLALQAMGLGGWTYTGYIARFALGGMDVPGLGFRFADAKRGPSVPVGRDGSPASSNSQMPCIWSRISPAQSVSASGLRSVQSSRPGSRPRLATRTWFSS